MKPCLYLCTRTKTICPRLGSSPSAILPEGGFGLNLLSELVHLLLHKLRGRKTFEANSTMSRTLGFVSIHSFTMHSSQSLQVHDGPWLFLRLRIGKGFLLTAWVISLTLAFTHLTQLFLLKPEQLHPTQLLYPTPFTLFRCNSYWLICSFYFDACRSTCS